MATVGAPAIHVKTPLLTRQQVIVDSIGDVIQVRIGNATLSMHYTSALDLCSLIRLKARQAKRKCGDFSRHWSVIGELEPLE